MNSEPILEVRHLNVWYRPSGVLCRGRQQVLHDVSFDQMCIRDSQIAGLGKAGHRIKQRCKGLGAPRTWIDDKQKLFIHTGSPLLHTVLGFVFPQKTA